MIKAEIKSRVMRMMNIFLLCVLTQLFQLNFNTNILIVYNFSQAFTFDIIMKRKSLSI